MFLPSVSSICKKSVLVIGLLIFSNGAVMAAPEPTVVIINQVRGTECCDIGSIDILKTQLQNVHDKSLPATFALRFDALQNSAITSLFVQESTQIEPALLLEITPQLAKTAGVSYEGNTSHWYKAKYAFLVGYTQDERKKIIDTAMKKYKEVFKKYPTTTVGWMIDTWSLSYLTKNYGVTAHEMTREQFSLDSYTLYGGPINNPYVPSSDYALIPTLSSQQMPLILRQTVTDPLYTYGDVTSSYTSQANDYLSGKRDTSYFEKVVGSALFSSRPYGFALIGLETSMTSESAMEFQKQLALIAQWRDSGKVQVKNAHDATEILRGQAEKDVPVLTTRSEGDSTAFWIATTHYRLRVIQHGNDVRITDLRVYDPHFKDPYFETPTVTANAYWVVPWLIDGSREFTNVHSQAPKTILRLANDFASEPKGITLPQAANDTLHVEADTPLTLSYLSTAGKVQLVTQSDRWTLLFPSVELAQTVSGQLSSIPQHELLNFGNVQTGRQVKFTPGLKDPTASESAKLPTTLLPVNASTSANVEKSMLQYNNTAAVAGRNPIRLVLRLRDNDVKPVVLGVSQIETSTSGKDLDVTVSTSDETDGQYFIDVRSPTAQVFTINVSLGHTGWTTKSLRFVHDCPKEMVECIKHPPQFFWYFYTKIVDRLREK